MDNTMTAASMMKTTTVHEPFQDNFICTIQNDRDSFLEALHSFGAGRTTETIDVKELRFEPLPDPADVGEFCNYDPDKIAVVEDCINSGTRVYLNLDAEPLMLRDTALTSIYNRLDISGKALARLDAATLANHLNEYIAVGKGKGTLLHNNEKVEAILGKNYCLVPAEDVMDEAAIFFKDEGAVFQGGFICHQSASSVWNMGHRNIKIPIETGLEDRKFRQSVTIRTSDCGHSSITIEPVMQEADDLYGLKYSFPLRAEHDGGTNIDTFKKNLGLITAEFEAAADNVRRLAGIHLNYPANTLLFMLKWLNIPVKHGAPIFETRRMQWGKQCKTAFDVYSSLSDVLALVLGEDYSIQKAAEHQEKFARALRFRFEDYDVPGNFCYATEMRGRKGA